MVHYRSKSDRVYDTDKMDETRGDGNLELRMKSRSSVILFGIVS